MLALAMAELVVLVSSLRLISASIPGSERQTGTACSAEAAVAPRSKKADDPGSESYRGALRLEARVGEGAWARVPRAARVIDRVVAVS